MIEPLPRRIIEPINFFSISNTSSFSFVPCPSWLTIFQLMWATALRYFILSFSSSNLLTFSLSLSANTLYLALGLSLLATSAFTTVNLCMGYAIPKSLKQGPDAWVRSLKQCSQWVVPTFCTMGGLWSLVSCIFIVISQVDWEHGWTYSSSQNLPLYVSRGM